MNQGRKMVGLRCRLSQPKAFRDTALRNTAHGVCLLQYHNTARGAYYHYVQSSPVTGMTASVVGEMIPTISTFVPVGSSGPEVMAKYSTVRFCKLS
jgi:hypothetical protein